ncbi:MAG: SRPBCC family protein [Bacteroidales bacterium]|nr:SRPBCC family protein [Bacteroidales bacterium]
MMTKKSRITIKVAIDAPRKVVGNYVDDLNKITSFHPTVKRVDLLSGKQFREKGVKYQCVIPKQGQKEWSCIEEVTEYEKDKRMVTVTYGGSSNIEKYLGDFKSELLLTDTEKNGTLLTLRNYYNPKGLIGNIINIFFKWKFKKQFLKTFIGLKELIENENKTSTQQKI